MSNGIILAGGKGSRLGPLSAQISKALVSIGQRPHLFHQIELLRHSGCKQIIVVASPSTWRQISDMLDRAGHHKVYVCVQETPRGPVDALNVAASYIVDEMQSTYVLMSDTYLEGDLYRGRETWFGVCPAPISRSFCAYGEDGMYVDRVVKMNEPVTIGAYHFASTVLMQRVANDVMRAHPHPTTEVGMGEFLSCIAGIEVVGEEYFPTWQDIGDVTALGKARRDRFVARAHHSLTLDDAGIITKSGAGPEFEKQIGWLQTHHALPPRTANLVPQLYGISRTSYSMEYVDLPTLAELWLYWPGKPETWAEIITSIIHRLGRDLWPAILMNGGVITPMEELGWFVNKARSRLSKWMPEKAAAVEPLLKQAEHYFQGCAAVYGHGDLNFNNILYSINTGMFKLVDPRGETRVPLSYELAKLRYSYHAGFAAITHKLITLEGELLPQRDAEIAAIDDVVEEYTNLDKMQVAEACLLLAGAPLHSTFEGHTMFYRAKDLLEQVLL